MKILIQNFQFRCLVVLVVVTISCTKKIEQQNRIKTRKFEHKRIANATAPFAPQVQLKNGLTVIGGVDITEKQHLYFYFRGIPFAKPPIGELRFMPPVPLSGNFSRKTLRTVHDGSPCLQAHGSSTLGSEDCLYINIYTPSNGIHAPQFPRTNLSILPVMVWLYGGGYQVGDSRYKTYGPDYFMDEGGVVIVTFNYRLGIFGFFSTGDYAAPGNYGLKDQILALKWIKENIRSFGGNPEQVTIFGQSAGAVSITYLLQTPLTKGLFQRILLESGSNLCPWTLTRKPRPIAIAVEKMLNITARNSQALVDRIRRIDSIKLLSLQINMSQESAFENPLNGYSFGPVMESPQPGAVVVGSSHENLANGLFQHVPILLGFNSLEGLTFTSAAVNLLARLGPISFVPASMNIYDPVVANETNAVIVRHYFGPSPVNITPAEITQYISADEYNRPILETAKLYSQQQPPVYLYKFSYQGYLGSGNSSVKGVGHRDELPYIWRQASDIRNATTSDLLTRKRLITLWTNFALTGNPTPVRDPILQNVTWKRTNTAAEENLAYLDIGNNLVVGVNPNWPEFQWWNGLFNKYGNPPFNTY